MKTYVVPIGSAQFLLLALLSYPVLSCPAEPFPRVVSAKSLVVRTIHAPPSARDTRSFFGCFYTRRLSTVPRSPRAKPLSDGGV